MCVYVYMCMNVGMYSVYLLAFIYVGVYVCMCINVQVYMFKGV